MKERRKRDGLEPPSVSGNGVTVYSSLKQSLSASPSGSGTSSPAHELPPRSKSPGGEYFQRATMERNGIKSRRGSPPEHVDIPKLSTATEMAMVALQYLPLPVIVLSNFKTVVLANEAMGRLLGLDASDNSQANSGDSDNGSRLGLELLQGQTLSQIGVDLMHGGQIVWVNWEVQRYLL